MSDFSQRLRVRLASAAKHTAVILFAAGFGVFTAELSPARAQDIVTVPSVKEFTEGGSSNCIPLGIGCFPAGTTARYQQVYAASEFSGMRGIIDKIAFRLNCGEAPFDATGLDIEIRLSHTGATPSAMSGTFANNIGADETLVLQTPSLALSSAAVPAGSGSCPFAFDVIIDVDDTFVFNGADNLLLDVKMFNNPSRFFLDGETNSGVTSRVAAIGAAGSVDSSSGFFAKFGLVTRFTLAPPPVGEGDSDGDGIFDMVDNCPSDANADQLDLDGDGLGNVCDADADNDGVANLDDNCPLLANPDQIDADNDGFGDACVAPGSLAKNVELGAGSTVGEGSKLLKDVSIGADAVIGEDTIIHKDTTAGDGLVVGDNVIIAKSVTLGDNVQIGDSVSIGKESVLGNDVMVGDGTSIGIGVTIGDNTVIGANVVIEGNVTIGANVVIKDGAVIRQGTVIQDLATIGEGAFVGKNVLVLESATVGDFDTVKNNATVTP